MRHGGPCLHAVEVIGVCALVERLFPICKTRAPEQNEIVLELEALLDGLVFTRGVEFCGCALAVVISEDDDINFAAGLHLGKPLFDIPRALIPEIDEISRVRAVLRLICGTPIAGTPGAHVHLRNGNVENIRFVQNHFFERG